jgi:hypothetical protein
MFVCLNAYVPILTRFRLLTINPDPHLASLAELAWKEGGGGSDDRGICSLSVRPALPCTLTRYEIFNRESKTRHPRTTGTRGPQGRPGSPHRKKLIPPLQANQQDSLPRRIESTALLNPPTHFGTAATDSPESRASYSPLPALSESLLKVASWLRAKQARPPQPAPAPAPA